MNPEAMSDEEECLMLAQSSYYSTVKRSKNSDKKRA
jgi:hypothetical protein